jgi:hypothetical protein
MPVPNSLVSYGAGHNELYLSARAHFAPKRKLRSNLLSPLAHPRYAPMSGSSTGLKNLCIDPAAIVADTHSKLILIITDFSGRSMERRETSNRDYRWCPAR